MSQARDPVCGMIIETEPAPVEWQYVGVAYYFCSDVCREQFEANPDRYSAAGTQTEPDIEKHEPPRTTKGPITAPKFGSAGSGGAEFELGPEQHEKH